MRLTSATSQQGDKVAYFLYRSIKSCSKKIQRLEFFLLLALRQFTYYK
ncbi:hypothetical protein C4K04_4504 [Pseudomonas chlororaphis]|uniref:Uncharacterized protein n=1 Tax=Pseudomonas chlororaphis TaxID=587753 RepID=A0A3G7TSW1_9PSED|nr:hypothetical protein C4K04_4504 [Pseudomonas chlororaphis]